MDNAFTLASSAELFLRNYKKYPYYYGFIERLYASIIPEECTLLHIGCADGFIMRSIKPKIAVGIDDISFNSIWEGEKGTFYESLDMVTSREPFEYILISAAFLKTIEDNVLFFKKLRRFSTLDTRIIIEYSFKSLLPITAADMRHFCTISNLEIITEKNELLIPIGIPVIADGINYALARLPFINKLCIMRVLISRFIEHQVNKSYSVSIIIPCKNEAGNVEAAITRTPSMGSATEYILVDGNSKDATVCVMQEMVRKFPEKRITWFIQSGKGKKNAIEEGFKKAIGDIVMILDGDITVMPEELPYFYEALASGKGECINGTRLVYPMERQAMKSLNWIVNTIFAVMISTIIGQKVRDTLCGTKVFFRKQVKIINESKKRCGDKDPFGDFDILCGAAFSNLKILDMPIHYKKREYGSPGVPFFKSGILLLTMTIILVKKFFFRT